ncbi:MAG: HPr(Ser) kinase/phosphatase [Gammaproteobacteria bacterium]|nr:HPr(Ser) kinase/phosphatase [Gammaproteobacteria bacterium]
MKQSLEIEEFIALYQTRLSLSFLTDKVGLQREISLSRLAGDTFLAVDYFNVIRTSSVVIVGFQEARFIHSMTSEQQTLLFKTLFQGPVCIIIISEGNSLPESILQLCQAHSISILQSELNDSDLLDNTRYLLSSALAENCDEHGVYIEVYSVGVFLTGQSGVGKSELALALIARGHRLISDDITRFARIDPDIIDGRSPDLLTDFMEVRGLGILNIRAMFGANALKKNKTLRLIVKMIQLTHDNSNQFDRIGKTVNTRQILGLEIPEVTLPVAPGRNLAVIVEAAARNHLLNMNGYNSAEDFIERQRRAIESTHSRGNLL